MRFTKGLPRAQEVPCAEHGRLRRRTCASLRELSEVRGSPCPVSPLLMKPKSPLADLLEQMGVKKAWGVKESGSVTGLLRGCEDVDSHNLEQLPPVDESLVGHHGEEQSGAVRAV